MTKLETWFSRNDRTDIYIPCINKRKIQFRLEQIRSRQRARGEVREEATTDTHNFCCCTLVIKNRTDETANMRKKKTNCQVHWHKSATWLVIEDRVSAKTQTMDIKMGRKKETHKGKNMGSKVHTLSRQTLKFMSHEGCQCQRQSGP